MTQLTAVFEIDGPYRVKAAMYDPDGNFIELATGKTVTEAMHKLADGVAEWAVNRAIVQMAVAVSEEQERS